MDGSRTRFQRRSFRACRWGTNIQLSHRTSCFSICCVVHIRNRRHVLASRLISRWIRIPIVEEKLVYEYAGDFHGTLWSIHLRSWNVCGNQGKSLAKHAELKQHRLHLVLVLDTDGLCANMKPGHCGSLCEWNASPTICLLAIKLGQSNEEICKSQSGSIPHLAICGFYLCLLPFIVSLVLLLSNHCCFAGASDIQISLLQSKFKRSSKHRYVISLNPRSNMFATCSLL